MATSDTKYHVQMNAVTPDNTTVNVYPKNTPMDMIISDRTEVPSFPSGQKVESVEDVLLNMGDMAFKDESQLSAASSTKAGVVKVTDTPTKGSNDALSSNGAKIMDEKVVHNTDDEEIDGVKTFKKNVKIGNARFAYTTSGNDKRLDISFD